MIEHEPEPLLEAEEEKLIPHSEHKLLENKYSELENRVLHLQAEFENFQKRTEKESRIKSNEGKIALLKDLLVVLDELEEAKKHVSDEGVNMVFSKLSGVLKAHGLSEIDCSGVYSPQFHEVVGTKLSEKSEGTVIDVIRKGYMVSDVVLRPSMVIISTKKGE